MADFQLYAKALPYYNGQQMTEETEVSIKRTTGAQATKTVPKGFAGMSPGSPMLELSIKSAVPAVGFEVSTIGKDMNELRVVEFTIFCAGKTLVTKGFVTEDDTTHGADKAAETGLTAMCSFADWE